VLHCSLLLINRSPLLADLTDACATEYGVTDCSAESLTAPSMASIGPWPSSGSSCRLRFCGPGHPEDPRHHTERDVVGPADWTRQTRASWVAAIDRMRVGDHVDRVPAGRAGRAGDPLKPKTKAGYLRMTRTFFRALQEWEWIPRCFDPRTALATPRSIEASPSLSWTG